MKPNYLFRIAESYGPTVQYIRKIVQSFVYSLTV